MSRNQIFGTVDLIALPVNLWDLLLGSNKLTADPMEDHLFVVAWTSTHPWVGSGNRRLFLWGSRMPLVARRENATNSLWIKARDEISPPE